MQSKKIFFSFCYELGSRTRAKKAEEGRTRSKTSVSRARGYTWALCTGFYRGELPHGRPRCLMTATHSKNAWICAGVGRCRPRSGPKWIWTWKSSKFMHVLGSKLLWLPFSSKISLGHLFKSKTYEGCKCKRWGIKMCKGFCAKDANAHAIIKWKWMNSNMQWSKLNMG